MKPDKLWESKGTNVEQGWQDFRSNLTSDRFTVKMGFDAGAKWTAKETLDILRQAATTCRDLGSQELAPEEVFGLVADNLEAYFKQIGIKL